jgi:hypothetical protein
MVATDKERNTDGRTDRRTEKEEGKSKLDYRSQLTNCYWHQPDRQKQKQKQITFSIIGFIGRFFIFDYLKWIQIESVLVT